nr:hypothetical protein Q903MT_gene1797 [Picea sitchensis]
MPFPPPFIGERKRPHHHWTRGWRLPPTRENRLTFTTRHIHQTWEEATGRKVRDGNKYGKVRNQVSEAHGFAERPSLPNGGHCSGLGWRDIYLFMRLMAHR